ncbi:MAG: hypothetical protein EOM41_06695 [Bacilli bacterium]|nr:hypothetical protein [Bacilli bacterium]
MEGFLSGLGSIGNTFKSGIGWLNDNAKGLGTMGQLWGAYNQYDMGNKIYDLQKNAFDYNKALSEEERKRRAQSDSNLASGFSNSTYGRTA